MTIHDFSALLGTGEERRLTDYRGKVLLVVNVASKCGFTPQYIGLQSLYEQFQGDCYLLRRYLWRNFRTVRQDRGQR